MTVQITPSVLHTFLLFYAYVCALTPHHEPLLTRAKLCCSLCDIKKCSTSVVYPCHGHWDLKLLPTLQVCGIIHRTALQIQGFKTPTICASAAEHRSKFQHLLPCKGTPFTANPPDVCPHMRKELRLARRWLLQLECTSPHRPTRTRHGNTLSQFSPGFKGKVRCSDRVLGSGQVLCSFQALESNNRNLTPSVE